MVRVVTSTGLATTPDVKMTQGGRLLFVLLNGNDYAAGVPGFGPKISHAVTRYKLGDVLLQNARTLSYRQLQDFLPGWRAQLVEIVLTDPRRLLPSNAQHSVLSEAIPLDFPNLMVLRNYALPLTSWSHTSPEVFNAAALTSDEPNITALATTCEEVFSWASQEKLLKKFDSIIWRGCVLRSLCVDAAWCDCVTWERINVSHSLSLSFSFVLTSV